MILDYNMPGMNRLEGLVAALALGPGDDIEVRRGDDIEVLPAEGVVINHTLERQFTCEKIPPELMEIVTAGGMMPWLERKLARERA